MENYGATDEFGIVQQQLCIAIPGAKTVQQVLPYQEETVGSVKYERFTDGVTMRRINNVLKKCEEKVIIRRTTTSGGVITREHTLDYWDNRKKAKYVPICHVLNIENGFRPESRLFA